MRFAVCLFLALAALPATAAEVTWHGVVIAYDAATWRTGDPDGPGGIAFTCIAADCKHSPTVFATAAPPPPPSAVLTRPFCGARLDTQRAWGHSIPLIDLSGERYALSFAAAERWSGCRAMDEPILDACAENNGLIYRFTTHVADGCNFDPPVPAHHFQALLRGVRPAR
jgi:hypothetical protein